MDSPHDFPPAEITLPLGGERHLFRMGLVQIAQLQDRRGYRVSWADGAAGRRPKAMGAIWRELAALGEYDPLDCVEIVRQALMGGGKTLAEADHLVETYVATPERLVMPLDDLWQMAATIMGALCQGYRDPDAPPPKDEPDPQTEATAAAS